MPQSDGEWVHLGEPGRSLPLDTMRDVSGDTFDECRAVHPTVGLICTRVFGHTRRHAASNGHYVIAVWK